MLIEELIRLGQPVLESSEDPGALLRLITDACANEAKNFYRHVIVVELPPEGSDAEPTVLPLQNWQTEQPIVGQRKPTIDVDKKRALGAPIILPSGGNSLTALGPYALPVYPIYHKHWFGDPKNARASLKEGWLKNKDAIRYFLSQRLAKTAAVKLHESVIAAAVDGIYRVVRRVDFEGIKNVLGVLVLARCEPDGFYRYSNRESLASIGKSHLQAGFYIEPNSTRIATAFLEASLASGAAMGRLPQSICSVSGKSGPVVSAYCKAWPWALPEWGCPIAHAGDKDMLVEGVALSQAAYQALTVGANLFHCLTKPLHWAVLPELFAPVENRDRENAARKRSKLTAIQGSALLLPLRDETLADATDRAEFARRILAMLDGPAPPEPLADHYLTAVTGFDLLLPEELNRDEFRLTLVYFSSGGQAADVHLRAYIQDVLPSTAAGLKKLVRPCREQVAELVRLLSPAATEKILPYLNPRYQSVPYLLARGYGGSHLWAVLEGCLHRRALDAGPVVAHVAARIRSVVPRWPDSRFEVIDEVIFLLVCRDFIHRYNREVAEPPKEDAMPMRPWRELLEMIEKRPLTEMRFQADNVAELGFGCGALIRRFSRWYWLATKVGREGKDYLKHRVLTFGADLSPEVIWRVGLGKLCDVAARYETRDRQLGRTFRERLGILLTEFEHRKEQVKSNRDEFMTAFWAGYCLQGYDRPPKRKAAVAVTKGGER